MEPLNEFFSWNLRNLGVIEEERLLSDAEVDELFELMADDDLPDAAMTLEQADGYLTALVVGPEPVPVHEWMEAIFAQPTLPLPQDQARQQRLLHLLCARYLDIQLRLAMTGSAITADTLYTPLHAQVPEEECITPYQLGADERRTGHWVLKEWADGFRLAMDEDGRWDELIEDPEAYGLLSAVMLYHLGYNPDRPEMQVDQQEDLQMTLIQSMYALRPWWRNYHRDALPASLPYEREAPKVGRNDPCPCGSGKKYKKCCGA